MMVVLFNKRLERLVYTGLVQHAAYLDPDFPKAGKAPAPCGSPSQAIRTIEPLSSQTDVPTHQYLTVVQKDE